MATPRPDEALGTGASTTAPPPRRAAMGFQPPELGRFRRPVDDPLDEAQLNALLHRIRERFGWAEDRERFRLTSCWSSRTAALYRCTEETKGSPDVLLKAGRGWSPDAARKLYEELDGLAHDLGDGSPTMVRVPLVLGWDGAPPVVCMRYIEGTEVYFLLEDLDHPVWAVSRWSPPDLIAQCGRGLGAYHSRSRASGEPNAPTAQDEAARSLQRAASAMRAPRRPLDGFVASMAIAPSFGDIGPHQLLLASSDDLYLLDPPVSPPFAPVHRDVAGFLFQLMRILGREAAERGRQQRRAGTALSEAFLRGYAETGPTDLRTPQDRWLIAMFRGHASGAMAHQRLKNRRYAEALRYGSASLRTMVSLRLGGRGTDRT